jgi:hypothetical protein
VALRRTKPSRQASLAGRREEAGDMISHRVAAIPLVVAFAAAISIIYALKFGVFPLDWASRSTQPIRFWLEMALSLAVCVGCLVWTTFIIIGFFN